MNATVTFLVVWMGDPTSNLESYDTLTVLSKLIVLHSEPDTPDKLPDFHNILPVSG